MAHWREFVDTAAPQGGYLSWGEVKRRTSLSRTTAWRLQKRDEFPRAYPISPGRVGHLEREVEAWITARASLNAPALTPARPPDVAVVDMDQVLSVRTIRQAGPPSDELTAPSGESPRANVQLTSPSSRKRPSRRRPQGLEQMRFDF